MNKLESLIESSSPKDILSPNFIIRLEALIRNTGKATMKNPLGAAAGLAMVVTSAIVLIIAVTGRIDLLPEIIGSILRMIGVA